MRICIQLKVEALRSAKSPTYLFISLFPFSSARPITLMHNVETGAYGNMEHLFVFQALLTDFSGRDTLLIRYNFPEMTNFSVQWTMDGSEDP